MRIVLLIITLCGLFAANLLELDNEKKYKWKKIRDDFYIKNLSINENFKISK